MSSRARNLKRTLLRPWFVVLVICLGLLAINIAFIGKLRPFNSDDLYWQQVVRTWHPFSGHTLYFGTKDTFVEESPFFAIAEHIFSPSRRLLIAETLALTLSSFTLFYISSLYFMRRLRLKLSYINLLPFIWLSSFGYPIVQNYLNSDWRTFELGFSFLSFALVAAYLNSEIHPFRSLWTKLLTGIFIIYTGILMYSDPYYTFFTIAPIALFTLGLFYFGRIPKRRTIVVLGGVILGVFCAKVTALVWSKAGAVIIMDTPATFINFDDIVTNFVTSVHGLLIIFGADFFGRDIKTVGTIGSAMNALLLGYIVYAAHRSYVIVRKGIGHRWQLPQFWLLFLSGMLALVFLVYTSSTLVTIGNYRYYLQFVYAGVLLMALALGAVKSRNLRIAVASLLVLATGYNLASTLFTDSIRTQGNVVGNVSNSLNYRIIDAVKSQGLTKGYAIYWQANVNTYLSGNRVAFLPSLCTPDGKTSQFHWLIDGEQFNRKSDKSFYLIDPDSAQPAICSQKQLVAQFGTPAKILKLDNKTILIYDYDITSKIL